MNDSLSVGLWTVPDVPNLYRGLDIPVARSLPANEWSDWSLACLSKVPNFTNVSSISFWCQRILRTQTDLGYVPFLGTFLRRESRSVGVTGSQTKMKMRFTLRLLIPKK